MDGQFGIQLQGAVPIRLMDAGLWVVKALQMSADTESADHRLDPGQQCLQGWVVEMIPVIVGDQQIVNVGEIPGAIRITACKSFIGIGQGGGIVTKDGINQDALARQLDVIGGVSEPDHQIRMAVETVKVGLDGNEGGGGSQIFGRIQPPRQDDREGTAVTGQYRCGL
ncbi:hypothetical protein D3C87_1107950 [compost metagenome]